MHTTNNTCLIRAPSSTAAHLCNVRVNCYTCILRPCRPLPTIPTVFSPPSYHHRTTASYHRQPTTPTPPPYPTSRTRPPPPTATASHNANATIRFQLASCPPHSTGTLIYRHWRMTKPEYDSFAVPRLPALFTNAPLGKGRSQHTTSPGDLE